MGTKKQRMIRTGSVWGGVRFAILSRIVKMVLTEKVALAVGLENRACTKQTTRGRTYQAEEQPMHSESKNFTCLVYRAARRPCGRRNRGDEIIVGNRPWGLFWRRWPPNQLSTPCSTKSWSTVSWPPPHLVLVRWNFCISKYPLWHPQGI